MQRPVAIAVDTNILLDYAEGLEVIPDCIETLRIRVPGCKILILPTVLHELGDLVMNATTVRHKQLAQSALTNLLNPWQFEPQTSVPVGGDYSRRIASEIRAKGLIPENEVNDSRILAESGLLNCSILVSNDAHLKDINYRELKLLLDTWDVQTPLIVSPWKVVKGFFRSH